MDIAKELKGDMFLIANAIKKIQVRIHFAYEGHKSLKRLQVLKVVKSPLSVYKPLEVIRP